MNGQQPILLVDDSLFQRELIKALLIDLGCLNVALAEDGEQALAHVRACSGALPLLLVDLEMPRMNGLQLIEQLAHEGLRPPMAVVTASQAPQLAQVQTLADRHGLTVLGYLNKPVCAWSLKQILASSQPLQSPI